MVYLINLFFICSILGFGMEQGLMNLFNQKYNSSLLHGPWTIVYGVASLIILKIGSIIKSKKLNKFFEILLFLIINFFVLSLVEFIAGTLIEHILHIVYWDYSDLPLHLGKYVCVIVSLVWMIYAFLLNYVLYPWLKKLALKTPKLVTVILVILFVIDILYSIYEYLLYN